MRFKDKSDVQKHFSKKYHPLFLHPAKIEDYASNKTVETQPDVAPAHTFVISAENIVPSS